jgi:hypothetical protein
VITANQLFIQDPMAPAATAYHNVHGTERAASFLGGAFLTAWGASVFRTWYGMAAMALGAPILWRGVTGHCSMKQKLAEKQAAKVAL